MADTLVNTLVITELSSSTNKTDLLDFLSIDLGGAVLDLIDSLVIPEDAFFAGVLVFFPPREGAGRLALLEGILAKYRYEYHSKLYPQSSDVANEKSTIINCHRVLVVPPAKGDKRAKLADSRW